MLGGFFVLYCGTLALALGVGGGEERLRVGNCQNADLDAVFSLQCSVDGNNPSRISSKISSFHCQILKVFIFSLMI